MQDFVVAGQATGYNKQGSQLLTDGISTQAVPWCSQMFICFGTPVAISGINIVPEVGLYNGA